MAEKEYIVRGALMEKLDRKKPTITTQRYVEGFNDAIMRFRSMVHSAPAADVVEVVRCKDCEHYFCDTPYCKKHKVGYCAFDEIVKDKNHFCSYGERKEQE